MLEDDSFTGGQGNQFSNPAHSPGVSAIAIALGSYHTCAIVKGGNVLCWGENYLGQLGIGTPAQFGYRESPVLVDLGSGKTRSVFINTCKVTVL